MGTRYTSNASFQYDRQTSVVSHLHSASPWYDQAVLWSRKMHSQHPGAPCLEVAWDPYVGLKIDNNFIVYLRVVVSLVSCLFL